MLERVFTSFSGEHFVNQIMAAIPPPLSIRDHYSPIVSVEQI